MNKITIELTDEELEAISVDVNTPIDVIEKLEGAAKAILLSQSIRRKFAELVGGLPEGKPQNKEAAESTVATLVAIHGKAEAIIEQLALKHELAWVQLSDGRHFEKGGNGYTTNNWVTSTDECFGQGR